MTASDRRETPVDSGGTRTPGLGNRWRAVGLLFLFTAIIVNPWLVARLTAADGTIGSAGLVLTIFAFQGAALTVGLCILGASLGRLRILRWTFYLLYTVFFAGWVFHQSPEPSLGPYSWSYVGFLVVAAIPFFIPPVLAAMSRRLGGPRQTSFVLAPVTAILVAAWFASWILYDARRDYPFDPFVQLAEPEVPRFPTGGRLDPQISVLTLGGSTTRNRSLDSAQRYPTQLESSLRASSVDQSVSVFNAGQDWYTTRHSITTYAEHYYRLKPNVVVVMHGINDLYRSCTPRRYTYGPYTDRWSHYYGASINGRRPPPFWSFVAEQLVPNGSRLGPAEVWFSSLRFREREVDAGWFRSVRPFAQHLERLAEVAKRDGAEVVLVTQPSVYSASPADLEDVRLWFAKSFCLSSNDYFNRSYPSTRSMGAGLSRINEVVREVAACRGVHLADADAALSGQVEYFVDDVHYTAEGAEALAGTVLRAVEAGLSRAERSVAPASSCAERWWNQ